MLSECKYSKLNTISAIINLVSSFDNLFQLFDKNKDKSPFEQYSSTIKKLSLSS